MRKLSHDSVEQEILDRVVVRLTRPGERERWDALISTEHYLKSAAMVGEQLRYVAEVDGEWVALLGWAAGSYHLRPREQWINWLDLQRRQRLPFIANNTRFLLVDSSGRWPNLASRVLALCCQRLSEDWQGHYGHPILVVESFVDSQLFRGTAYKASGWTALGQTQGFERVQEDFYVAHGRPKQLWVKELHPKARQLLCAPDLPIQWQAAELALPVDDKVDISSAEMLSLWGWVRSKLPEHRRARGLRYRLPTMICLVLLALLCGTTGGYRQLAAFARRLSQKQREKLRCWRNPDTGKYEVPDEATFYRVLSRIDPAQLGRVLFEWQQVQLTNLSSGGGRTLLAIDGKEARRGKRRFLGAFNVHTKQWAACQPVGEKTNEIPVAQKLFEGLKLDGQLCMLDALHTQLETARAIVMEGGGDYILPLKENQSTILATAKTLLPESFPPSGQND